MSQTGDKEQDCQVGKFISCYPSPEWPPEVRQLALQDEEADSMQLESPLWKLRN